MPKTKAKSVNEPKETVVNKDDDAIPKLNEEPGETAVSKGGDDKKSQEQGKSTPPFQLKIKPVSK
ncbi:hypothetical protein AGABI2DRAFT_192122 [Agaricus bisporus var. bisporus H97]|uniref:hypothetical protein n=1 Tax=Agaricus bisporus var. bisporus (strain H97 / ATCC MYA-4626 / FGSC 10389) TaxID=936046 RepID=UPI00029F6E1A|nr:hypothetical protein AGABI2DRAFT_192122 [Agaricus bisporus var. bisporus H97]EKV48533.1 hypothetical protein AGABI2DRAFT_192122 [Agaricus bisporus var. bisporus H97]